MLGLVQIFYNKVMPRCLLFGTQTSPAPFDPLFFSIFHFHGSVFFCGSVLFVVLRGGQSLSNGSHNDGILIDYCLFRFLSILLVLLIIIQLREYLVCWVAVQPFLLINL